MSLTQKAKDVLVADVNLPLLSPSDIYGGKLVAALDRQHPRDLFDVSQLFANEGITRDISRCFVVYLASHNRPIHEVLFPTEIDISREYEATFRGMTARRVVRAARRAQASPTRDASFPVRGRTAVFDLPFEC